MFWKTVGRLLLVPIAFVLAAMTSLAVALSLGVEKVTHAMHGKSEFDTVEALGNLVFAGWDLLAGLSILPALAVVVVGEVARIRSWLYYVLAGGASLAIMPLLASMGTTDTGMPPAALWQVLASAGFAGGFVYWLAAGRNA